MREVYVEITREIESPAQTLGTCVVKDMLGNVLFRAKSLERAWADNRKRVSCVPLGTYKLVLERSHRFSKDLWELKGVPNRAECKFHSANFWSQLNGCIALGNDLRDINGDSELDVLNSVYTMFKFHEALEGQKEVKLIIK